jgi:hypothetical protein
MRCGRWVGRRGEGGREGGRRRGGRREQRYGL